MDIFIYWRGQINRQHHFMLMIALKSAQEES